MNTTIRRFFANSRIAILVAMCLLTPAVADNEDSWEVNELMSRFSEVTLANLAFVEIKKSIFVITDIVIKGDMRYRAPKYIEKNTYTPFIEKVVIDGDNMMIEKTMEAGKANQVTTTQNYSVQSHPVLKIAVESIRAILAGNFDALTEFYYLNLAGEKDNWQLTLEPKSAEILEHITQIKLHGEDVKIKEVVTIQADGDESVLKLTYQSLE